MTNLEKRGSFRLKQNIEYVLRDKNGKAKPLWNENSLARFFREELGISLPRIPLLFGFWGLTLNIHNLVVNAGMAGVASRINGAGGEAAFTFIAIGTGTVAPAAGDTTLGTEITTGGGARAAATASRVTTDVTNDTAQLVLTYNFTASFAVTESGAFNAASVGVMLARQTFSAINVANGDSLQVTWKFDVD